MTCGSCGTENRPGRKFCSRCGAGLAVACPVCAAPNDPQDAFCGECGAPLAAQRPADPSRGASVPAPVAERRLVSVLFADLVGFTSISETRDAESVRELLSRYFEACRRLVELYGGTVEKFIGDAVMAVWGAPVAQEDDAERAVRAALDLVAAVSALGDELGVDPLHARAGVMTGEAAVTLGAEGQGMVAGDLVNTAARIQAAADPGSVLVGDATRRASEAAVAYEPAGTHDLKGKVEPVSLFRALRVTSGRAGALRSAGLEPPFVGRERELRLVKELFHASAEQRRAQFVSVVGMAGIGKSRLGWEFFKYIDGLADTVYWHRGRCLPYGDGVAYWALAEMVRGRAGIADGEDVGRARALLADALAEHVPDPDERAWVEPRLANLLGLEERTDTHRQDLFAAWRVFFERLSDQYPVVLVFEDMQWGDAALLAFVEHLLEWSAGRPIFVLVLARPELFDRAPDFGRAVRNAATIALEPLVEAAMQTLLEGFAPGLPDDLQRSILARAQGVPLYAVETVRMLLDRRLLVQDGPVYRPAGPIATLEVPETLHALVAARLDGLEAAERRLVQDASVLGKTFARDALAAVVGAEDGRLDELLGGLVRKEVLSFRADPRSPERGQYGFLQDLVRQVAYETLSRRDRKARHLVAARLLHESVDGGDIDVPEVLASHYLAAYESAPEDPDAADLRRLAADALVVAGERAAALAAPEEGQRHFERAADLAGEPLARARHLERAGTLALRANLPAQARAHLEWVIAACDEAGEERLGARASAALADVDVVEGRLEEAVGRLERAVSPPLERGERTPELAAALAQLARVLTLRGEAARAGPVVEQALRMAEALALDRVFVDALNTKAVGLIPQGRLREALILLEAALAEARRTDVPAAWWRAANNLGFAYEAADRLRESEELLGDILTAARRIGDRQGEMAAAVGQITILGLLGRWADALAAYAEVAARTDAGPYTEAQLLDIVPVLCGRGEGDAAFALIERLSWLRTSQSPEFRAGFAYAEAAALRAVGRPGDALAAAERGLAVRGSLGIAIRVVKLCLVEALEAALAMGDLETARALLASVEDLEPGEAPPYLRASIARFRGRIAAAGGSTEDPGDAFAEAAALFERASFVPARAMTLIEHAEWLEEAGRSGEAAALAGEALAIFSELEARPWIDRARTLAPADAAPVAGA